MKSAEFIEKILVPRILKENEHFENHKLVTCVCEKSQHLDGFMSEIFMVVLTTQDENDKQSSTQMIVKLMRGDQKFREESKSYIQCFNEVYIYNTVLKYFSKFLIENNIQQFCVEDWCPKNFFSGFGSFPELSNIDEAVLVLENLTPKGYRSGPKLDLDEPHLMLMVSTIARYHSMTYALRVLKDPMLEQLVAGIKPLRFIEPNGANNLYTIVYKIALDRLFDFLDKSPEYLVDPKFVKDLENLRTKYGNAPLELMETFRSDDPPYSVILHGDFNRNNVLFKYEQPDGFENPIDMKMIDFQEIRYGSPALDLSFFMFMNIHQDLRPKVWEKLLKCYHETMFQSLVSIVGCDADDERLIPYRYESFYKHFTRFAFYGAMVAIHFIPWMASSDEEVAQLSHYFETDMFSPNFHDLVMVAGGRVPNEKIAAVVQFASKMGYMDFN